MSHVLVPRKTLQQVLDAEAALGALMQKYQDGTIYASARLGLESLQSLRALLYTPKET
jgi:hypothetical protein